LESKQKLWRYVLLLALLTIFYNFLEGLISIYWGIHDETLALFGFGLDSFVEVISGIGILHMVIRIKKNGEENRDVFEKRALQITGTTFFILSLGLVLSSIYNLYVGASPITTVWGSIIGIISIVIMAWLIKQKTKVGEELKSNAILADANCAKTCMHLSIILLFSSLSYELFNITSIDSIGSMFIAGIAYKEGKESFEKVLNEPADCC
jgi:divalent metal cation (Fe/Co/Zn/Cd) transporter